MKQSSAQKNVGATGRSPLLSPPCLCVARRQARNDNAKGIWCFWTSSESGRGVPEGRGQPVFVK